jgi:hypothetical protein
MIHTNYTGYLTGALQTNRHALAYYPLTPHVARQRQMAKRAKPGLVSKPEPEPAPVLPRRPLDSQEVWRKLKSALVFKYDRTPHFGLVSGLSLNTYDPAKQTFQIDAAWALPEPVEKEMHATLKTLCDRPVKVRVRVIGQGGRYAQVIGAMPL